MNDKSSKKTPAASTAGVRSAKTHVTNESTKPMNSNTYTTTTMPVLAFSHDSLQLRVIMHYDTPWFFGSDVCDALEIQNVTQAVARLDEDERAMLKIGHNAEVNIISEAGLYSLILGSRKPEAKPFKRWVTHEVLPSIRKTGSYSLQKQVPRDRQIKLCQSLMVQISRCTDSFARPGLVVLVEAAYADAGLPLPDKSLLVALPVPDKKQIPLPLDGDAS